jgi:integrase
MNSPIRLTDIAIRNLKPRAVRYELPDPGARGLYVCVFPSGKTSFVVRYRHAGVHRKLTLQAGVSLASARKLAADALHEVAQGRDPSAAKKEARAKTAAAAVNTVQFVCEEYFKREHGKLRSAADRESALRRLVFPVLGNRQIDTIKRSDVVHLIDRIEDNTGPRAADLALAYMRRIFHWHESRTDDFRSPVIRGMGRYDTRAHARSRVLNDAEIRKLWTAAEASGYFGSVIRFLLLTAARRSEAAGLRWDEIEDGVWTLPAIRNKTKLELVRPLSRAALALVEQQPRIGPFVFSFSGERATSFGRPRLIFLANCGVTGWRVHDLRRTSRTLLSRAGISPDVAERCLGHTIQGVRGIYDRHSFVPEMTHAFEALSAQIDRIVNPPDRGVAALNPARCLSVQ